MDNNNFKVGQVYRYTDNDQIYSLMIDRVGVDNVYYSTISPRRVGGGSFHKDSSLAGLLTLSGESDGLLCVKDQRIKELESTMLDLQSELARKKMSLTVACNRVEELEDKLSKCQEISMGLGIKYNEQQDKLRLAVSALRRVDNIAYEIDNKEINDIACNALEQLGELK